MRTARPLGTYAPWSASCEYWWPPGLFFTPSDSYVALNRKMNYPRQRCGGRRRGRVRPALFACREGEMIIISPAGVVNKCVFCISSSPSACKYGGANYYWNARGARALRRDPYWVKVASDFLNPPFCASVQSGGDVAKMCLELSGIVNLSQELPCWNSRNSKVASVGDIDGGDIYISS